jgi:hypothetical protein
MWGGCFGTARILACAPGVSFRVYQEQKQINLNSPSRTKGAKTGAQRLLNAYNLAKAKLRIHLGKEHRTKATKLAGKT